MQDATRCALSSPGFLNFTSPAFYRFVLAGLGFPRQQRPPRGTIWLVIRAAATNLPRETWQLTITVTAPSVSSCIREGIRAASPHQDRRPTITAQRRYPSVNPPTPVQLPPRVRGKVCVGPTTRWLLDRLWLVSAHKQTTACGYLTLRR